jgi:hypothetical protein
MMTTNSAADATAGACTWSDSAPAYAEPVADLYRWSVNCEHFRPWCVFLDLSGLSADVSGEPAAEWHEPADGLGMHELALLGAALEAYALRPTDVTAWIRDLVAVEMKWGL